MSARLRELLPLYVGGGATEAERAEVEAALRADPSLAEELAFHQDLAAALGALEAEQDAADGSPGPFGLQRLMREIDRPRRLDRRALLMVGGAAAASLALGVVFGGALIGPALRGPGAPAEPPGWKLSAAIYQRLFAADTFALSQAPEPERRAGVARLAGVLGFDPDALRGAESFTLQRADLLRYGGRALGQIAYLSPEGAAVSLCVMRRIAGDIISARPTALRLAGLNAVEWGSPSHLFLLVGAAEPSPLLRQAERFAAALA